MTDRVRRIVVCALIVTAGMTSVSRPGGAMPIDSSMFPDRPPVAVSTSAPGASQPVRTVRPTAGDSASPIDGTILLLGLVASAGAPGSTAPVASPLAVRRVPPGPLALTPLQALPSISVSHSGVLLVVGAGLLGVGLAVRRRLERGESESEGA